MLAVKIVTVFVMGTAVGVLYRIPRNVLLYGSLNATLSWLVSYLLTGAGANPVTAVFCGGVATGVMAELLARLLRKPTTIFAIPGFIPLVPGLDAYSTMRYMVEGQYQQAAAAGMQTMLTAGAIAFGLFVSITLYRLLIINKFTGGANNVQQG